MDPSPLLWLGLTFCGCAVGVLYPLYRQKRAQEEKREVFFISEYTQERVPVHDAKITRTWRLRKLRELETQLGVTLLAEEQQDRESADKPATATWLPTPHGFTLARCLQRELACVAKGKDVLELGAGCGIHSHLLKQSEPSSLTLTEITDEGVAALKDVAPCIKADWLHLPHKRRYDLIVANPPFFHCTSSCNRRYYLDELILNAHRYLHKGGELLFVQSSMAGDATTLAMLKQNGFSIIFGHQEIYRWRDYYFEDHTFVDMANNSREGRSFIYDEEHFRLEKISVIHAVLRHDAPL